MSSDYFYDYWMVRDANTHTANDSLLPLAILFVIITLASGSKYRFGEKMVPWLVAMLSFAAIVTTQLPFLIVAGIVYVLCYKHHYQASAVRPRHKQRALV